MASKALILLDSQWCQLFTNGQESPGCIYLSKLVIFLLKIPWNLKVFGKIDWSVNSWRRRRGIARDIWKSLLIFKTLQKWLPSWDKLLSQNVEKGPGYTCPLFSFFLKKIPETIFIWYNGWSMNSGRQMAGNS